MCGIIGLIASKTANIPNLHFKKMLDKLYLLSESRGKEASGYSLRQNGEIITYRQAIPASKLIKTSSYKKLFNKNATLNNFSFIGHSRLVTNGLQYSNINNQPVSFDNITGVHNGIIVNYQTIWHENPELHRKSNLDTEAFMALISKYYKINKDFKEVIRNAFRKIEGSASIAVLPDNKNIVALATNTGSLYLCLNHQKTIAVFASEAYILKMLIQTMPAKKYFMQNDIQQLKAKTGMIIRVDDLSSEFFQLPEYNLYNPGISQKHIQTIKNPCIQFNVNNSLKRCSKCILPETMPFITFNNYGVCNYCIEYQTNKLKPVAQLEEILTKHRKNNGEPDCIVGFSGGRDSSYGLHYLKTELNMTPLAITYDWGMVTDLARRNQARICGKLGIEHIIVSANLIKKRRNIGKNVTAWLKNPQLGMIPLFMAGDKQFFHYVQKLRMKTNIDLSVMCVNPLEYTYFKTGFAGIEKTRYYKTSCLKKISLIMYYIKNMLKTPSYLNTSIIDTTWAFFSTYSLKHNYIMLSDYTPWNEDEINNILINEYDWEVATDTTTTWRIGDGTAAFYNYIYYHVAGFTENDTFRSNQIREGIITREQALQLVASENQPRIETIKEYLNLIGLNFENTMRIIKAIPQLY